MKLSATITLLAILSAIFPIESTGATTTPHAAPTGWAICSSIFTAGDYDLSGGGEGSVIVIRSDGTDMREAIRKAIITHDVIVFDGIEGDFEVSSSISLQSLRDRTLIGVNGACLHTNFAVTQEMKELLDSLDVGSLSQSPGDNLGGTLSNGIEVVEQRELAIRQALIDRYGDPKEPYRHSGVFTFNGCSNIIVQNLDFAGPGSIDVGGYDLITLIGCDHIWIDHCRFTDGMDGNVDIIGDCDFITVSDTHFQYTDKSYNHPLSNLTWGTETTDGSPQKNNISWIRCYWGEGCTGRMPRISYGIHHLLNCYWDCKGGTSIDAHDMSKLLIEGCYFTNRVGKALAVRQADIEYECRGSIWAGKSLPTSNATINLPYTYTADGADKVPERVKRESGPTLANAFTRELMAAPAAIDLGKVYAGHRVEGRFNISAFGSNVPSSLTFTAPEGMLLSLDPSGDFSPSLTVDATDEKLIQADVYVSACFDRVGHIELPIVVTAPEKSLTIPVKAEVVGLGEEQSKVSLTWPLEGGGSIDPNATTSHPEAFIESTLATGEKMRVHSSKKIGGTQTFTLFNPSESIGKVRDEECCIELDVIVAPGYTFIPKMLRLNAARIATDMCLIDIECSREEGETVNLLSGFQPTRSSDWPYYSELSLPMSNVGVGDTLHVKLYLYNMTDNKQLALSNVSIEGEVARTESGIGKILTDIRLGKIEYYDLAGRRILHPQEGRPYLTCDTAGSARVMIYQP